MIDIIIIPLLCVFIYGILKIIFTKNLFVNHVVLFLFSIFGFAYYIFPILIDSKLSLHNNFVELIFINTLFIFPFILGLFRYKSHTAHNPKNFSHINYFTLKNRKSIFYISWLITIVLTLNYDQSFYNSGVSEDTINLRFSGLISLINIIFQSFLCLTFILIIKNDKKNLWFFSFLILVIVISQSISIQRLQTIRIFTFIAIIFMTLYRDKKIFFKYFSLIPLILLLSSPLFNYLRSVSYLSNNQNLKFNYSFDEAKYFFSSNNVNFIDYVSDSYNILSERSDLSISSLQLIDYIRNEDFNYSIYFQSVVYQFVPGFLIDNKPYPLSDDGTINKDLSVISYKIKNGSKNLGSLTTFGPIIAHREGNYIWVIINGFMSGLLISFLLKYISKYGVVGVILSTNLIYSCVIKKVPASFFEVIQSAIQIFFIFMIIYFINQILKKNKYKISHIIRSIDKKR